jgi:aspartate dehydrogenase
VKRKKLKIGIVGCGAIGTSLSLLVAGRFKNIAEVVALHDLDEFRANNLCKKLKNCKVVSLSGLILRSDLVVEAAGAKVSFDIAKSALSGRKDVLVMSIGGVLGKESKLFEIARKYNAKIYFPSGAICGIDGIKALALAGIDRITLKTLKPPAALKGADYVIKNKIDLDSIKGEKVIFRGSAYEAVKAFPQNINVVALLSLAAEGQVVPEVVIVASPGLKRNIHIIEVESKAARLEIKCENVPSPQNPKTSYLAILSAVRTIAGICDVVRTGT